MKVLIITPFSIPGAGGSSRLMQDIADHLTEQGHEVEVVTFSDPASETSLAFDKTSKYSVRRIKPSPAQGKSSWEMLTKALSVIKRSRIDMMLCGAAYPTAILAYALKLITRVPYVVYTHGEDVTCVEGLSKKAALVKRALQDSSYVMANSNFSLNHARGLGANEGSSEVVPPAIDPTPYHVRDSVKVETLRVRLGLGAGPIILTLARLQPRKGHDTVIRALPQAVKAAPDLQYLIVGYGDQTRLREIAAENDVADRVKFVEYLADEDLPTLFQLCDIYAMVSRVDTETNEVEGFGMVYLEAGASKKPSIAGSAGGCPDAVENGVTGFVVDPESSEQVGDALVKVLSNPTLAQKMGTAGRERVDRLFTKAATMPRIEQILCESRKGAKRNAVV